MTRAALDPRSLAPLLLLAVAVLCAAYARVSLSVVQEQMQRALHLTDNQISILQGPALALPFFFASVPIGMLLDRWPRNRLLVVFCLLLVAATACTGLARDFTELLVVRCVAGLGATGATTTAFLLLADRYSVAVRGRAITLLTIAQFVGVSLSFALAGNLLTSYSHTIDAWRTASIWLSVPLLLGTIAAIMLRSPPATTRKNPGRLRDQLHRLRPYALTVSSLITGLVLVEFGLLATTAWGASSLARRFAMAPDEIGSAMGIATLASGFAGAFAGGFFADYSNRRGGTRHTLAVLPWLALLSCPMGLFAIAPTQQSALLMLFVYMTLIGFIAVLVTALFVIIIPSELLGLSMSLMAGIVAVFGVAAAPTTVSMVAGLLGGASALPSALSAVSVTAGLVGCIALAWVSQHQSRLSQTTSFIQGSDRP